MTDLRFNASLVIGLLCHRTTQLHRRAVKMICLIPLVFLSALVPDASLAQVDTNFKAADTSSPRDTLKSFIDACNELDNLITTTTYFDRSDPAFIAVAERALDCLDDSELPAFARLERAGEAAACLKEILDRVKPKCSHLKCEWREY